MGPLRSNIQVLEWWTITTKGIVVEYGPYHMVYKAFDTISKHNSISTTTSLGSVSIRRSHLYEYKRNHL